MEALSKEQAMNTNGEANLAVDTIIAGSVMTMPLWAVNLNGWLHLFMALAGSILIIYRLFKLVRDIKGGE